MEVECPAASFVTAFWLERLERAGRSPNKPARLSGPSMDAANSSKANIIIVCGPMVVIRD